jgi:hypothetical protein
MKKRFLAIYMGTESSLSKWESQDEATRSKKEEAGMKAWMKWANENQNSIVDNGTPIGPTKLVNPSGVSDTKNRIAAYTVVEAESHDAAAKLFLNHPHFTIFPGDSVEVMECLPMPEM